MKETVNKISENMTITAMAAAEGQKTTAVIDIEGDIGENWWTGEGNSAKSMKKELKAIGKLNVDEIIVNIHSLGGSVDHGLAIHDLLRENKAYIITKFTGGMSASAATVIGQAGDRRIISDNTLYLVHRAWSCICGNAINARIFMEDMEKIDSRIANIYSKRSGKSKDEMLELMDRDNGNGVWLEPDEVLEYGLVDEIYEPEAKIAAAASVRNKDFMANLSKQIQLPELPEAWKNKFPEPTDKPEDSDIGSSPVSTLKEPLNVKTNNKPLTKENKMENIKDFREAFGADCGMSYLEAGLSFEQATAAHKQVEPLNAKIKVLEASVGTETARADAAETALAELQKEKPLKADAATPPNGGKDPKAEIEDLDPVADFNAKVNTFVADGLSKPAARIRASAENPELYAEYVAAMQPK